MARTIAEVGGVTGDQLMRTFVLRDAAVTKLLWNFIKANAADMAARDEPLEVRISIWKPKASDAQRALIWVINEQIAQGAWVGGRRYDAETWHEQAKRDLLPDETRKGVKKWRTLANGDRVLNMSTEHLDREEKTVYINELLAYAANLGVSVHIDSPTA